MSTVREITSADRISARKRWRERHPIGPLAVELGGDGKVLGAIIEAITERSERSLENLPPEQRDLIIAAFRMHFEPAEIVPFPRKPRP